VKNLEEGRKKEQRYFLLKKYLEKEGWKKKEGRTEIFFTQEISRKG
jgi:hypothetical protein